MATTLTSQNKEYIPMRWETPACPFCGENSSRLLERFGFRHRYTYERCVRCGLAYQKPRPIYDQEFTETAYELYAENSNPLWRAGKFTEQGERVFREYSHILRELEALIKKKGRILDIGCNTGFFLKVAKDNGWSPVGVEISRTMVGAAKKDFQVEAYAGDWMQLDFSQPFDVIYSSHVIEHVPNPADWMLRFKKYLNPGGVVCLSVPNMNSIDRKFKRVLKRLRIRKDRWQPWQTPDHLYEPCEKSMRWLIQEQGYEVVSTYTYPSEWMGQRPPLHRVMHFALRWGAKQRYYLRPLKG